MIDECTRVRELLADLDPLTEGALPVDAAEHVAGCDGCRALLSALAGVDAQLVAMADMEVAEVEVPEALMTRTLEAVRSAEVINPSEVRVGIGALMWGTVAGLFGGLAAFVGGIFGGLGVVLSRRRALWLVLPGAAAAAGVGLLFLQSGRVADPSGSAGWPEQLAVSVFRDQEVDGRFGEPGVAGALVPDPVALGPGKADETSGDFEALLAQATQPGVTVSGSRALETTLDTEHRAYELHFQRQGYRPQDSFGWWNETDGEGQANRGGDVHQRGWRSREVDRDRWESGGEELPGQEAERLDNGLAERLVETPRGLPSAGEAQNDGDSPVSGQAGVPDRSRTVETGRRGRDETGRRETGRHETGRHEPQDRGEYHHRVESSTVELSTTTGRRQSGQRAAAGRAVAAFLAERERHQGVAVQSPTGMWANTYLPGDPGMRQLERRLRESGQVLADGLSGLAVAELAEANDQPFDAPENSALAVYVHADRRGVEGPSRVMLQVGLKGIAHRTGRRPALRVAVVLDATSALSDDAQGRVRALLSALSRARQTGDRISVHVAGPQGGVLLPPGELRYGQVEVAMRRLSAGEDLGGTTTLPQAMRTAATSVSAGNDEGAALGSSLVLLVTPDGGAHATELSRVAHVGSLAGVTTSVIGLDAATVAAAEPIALAGQGQRSVLSSPAEATELVRSEVEAVSRIVARAVRVRIRLAPGVQLVDILGSHRLDQVESTRVQAAERAADLQLAAELGITADRGEERDGIQIVIPAFRAEDAHVVLLDVIVPGPGPVADVGVRFKDLVGLRNGTADGTLALGRVNRAPGPLEVAVLKNMLTHQMANALGESSALLAAGDPAAALARVEHAQALLEGIAQHRPELGRDRQLTGDVDLVARYMSALREAAASGTTSTLVDSMRYAAALRMQ